MILFGWQIMAGVGELFFTWLKTNLLIRKELQLYLDFIHINQN